MKTGFLLFASSVVGNPFSWELCRSAAEGARVGEPVQDPLLGPLTWDADRGWWTFDAGPIGGRSVEALIIPDPTWEPMSEASRSRIRACLDWVQANEPAIQSHIGADMFDWWCGSYAQEEDEVSTPEEFAAAIELEGITFAADGLARLVYDDANLVGGHGIWLSVGPTGEFSDGPDITG